MKSFELLIKEAADCDKAGNFKGESAMLKILNEQERFRQDCRKRALDLAAQKIDYDTINLADKYYKWLTDIPETATP